MWNDLIISFYLIFQTRNFIFITFFLWLFKIVNFIQQHKIHKKTFAFHKKIEMIEKTIKLFLFENDACFRDKTLINCKQTIIHWKFMSNKAIKVHNMLYETKSLTNETVFFSIWLNDSFMFSYEFFKTINLYSYKSFKKFKSLKLITKFLLIFTIHFKNSKYSTKIHNLLKSLLTNYSFFFNRISNYWTFIHVNLNFRKLLLKHFRTRQISLLKLTKFERWITSQFIEFVNN